MGLFTFGCRMAKGSTERRREDEGLDGDVPFEVRCFR